MESNFFLLYNFFLYICKKLKNMKDKIGDRMKSFYEDRTRFKLQRKTNTIIRIDGKSFHTYTKGLKRPFDQGLIDDMNETAVYLCKNIQGAKFAYVQSDEISIILTDYDSIQTDAWFDGNIQKITSISSSLATAKFNQLRENRRNKETSNSDDKLAMFDSRVFQIPYVEEVLNYFIWRQQDATRNSIQLVAQSLYSHKELKGKNSGMLQEMIFQKGINWNDFSNREKRGSIIRKFDEGGKSTWKVDNDTPIFTYDREYLKYLLPLNPDEINACCKVN